MAMKCAQCGIVLVPGARSCGNCGQQFAAAVPPDPPVGASLYDAPPQAPNYGYAPYGQQPPPQTVPPISGPKKFAWFRNLTLVLLVVRVILLFFHHGSYSDPSPPPTPANSSGLPDAVAVNYAQVDVSYLDFITINKTPKPTDASWRAQMEQNAHALKAAADAGQTVDWPSNLQDAQTDYRAGLAQVSEVAADWPSAVEKGDQAGVKDCTVRLQSGAQEVLHAVHLAQSRGAGK